MNCIANQLNLSSFKLNLSSLSLKKRESGVKVVIDEEVGSEETGMAVTDNQ